MYRYKPSEKAHAVDDGESGVSGRTLCGIAHEGDVQDIGDDPDDVLPTYLPYCYRCRAVYVKRVREALDVDVTSLSEGDRIEYWTHDDPTDSSSSLCLRDTGDIVEVPPWTETMGEEEVIVTGKYKVHHGGNTYAYAGFDRIWRVNDDALELSGGVFG
jgi:hypothetical protein